MMEGDKKVVLDPNDTTRKWTLAVNRFLATAGVDNGEDESFEEPIAVERSGDGYENILKGKLLLRINIPNTRELVKLKLLGDGGKAIRMDDKTDSDMTKRAARLARGQLKEWELSPKGRIFMEIGDCRCKVECEPDTTSYTCECKKAETVTSVSTSTYTDDENSDKHEDETQPKSSRIRNPPLVKDGVRHSRTSSSKKLDDLDL